MVGSATLTMVPSSTDMTMASTGLGSAEWRCGAGGPSLLSVRTVGAPRDGFTGLPVALRSGRRLDGFEPAAAGPVAGELPGDPAAARAAAQGEAQRLG